MSLNKPMKTSLLLCFFMVLLLVGCEPAVEPIPSLYDRTTLYNPDSISFENSIDFGQSLNDSVDIRYVSSCFIRSYFVVSNKGNNMYDFELKSIIRDNTNDDHICFDTPVISKASFVFVPTNKGTYTLRVFDYKDTIIRYLEVK